MKEETSSYYAFYRNLFKATTPETLFGIVSLSNCLSNGICHLDGESGLDKGLDRLIKTYYNQLDHARYEMAVHIGTAC